VFVEELEVGVDAPEPFVSCKGWVGEVVLIVFVVWNFVRKFRRV
jgi:hypothetical protein